MKAKVCLVGANLGCKTNLVRRHVRDEFDDLYIRTLGAKVSKKKVKVAGSPESELIGVDLTIWDILSNRGFAEMLREAYFHGTRGIVAVADMTRRKTLEDLGAWIEDVVSQAGDIPVVVIGANQDAAERREVSEEDVQRLADSYGAACFFASANSEAPVEEAFVTLAERIASRGFRAGTDPSPPATAAQ